MTQTDRDEGVDPVLPDGGFFDLDEVLAALTKRERRVALYCLREDEIMTTRELARAILAIERGVPENALDESGIDSAERRLVHLHLPHLKALSFVEYDSVSQTVRFREPPDTLIELLETCERLE